MAHPVLQSHNTGRGPRWQWARCGNKLRIIGGPLVRKIKSARKRMIRKGWRRWFHTVSCLSALHLFVSVVDSYVSTDSLIDVQSQCSTSKNDLISLLHKLALTWVLMRNRVTGAFNPLLCPHPHISRTSYTLHKYTLINTKIRTYISTRTETHKYNHMHKKIIQCKERQKFWRNIFTVYDYMT